MNEVFEPASTTLTKLGAPALLLILGLAVASVFGQDASTNLVVTSLGATNVQAPNVAKLFELVFGETSTVKRLTLDEQQVREYEAVLARAAPGSDLRGKAFHPLILALIDLQNTVERCSRSDVPGCLTAQEKAEWEPKALAAWQRMRDLIAQYLTTPPKKVNGVYYHHLPAYRLRLAAANDAQPLIDWYLLLDSVYGADHEAYDTRCPFICLAQQFLWAKQPQQALAFYLRGMEAHHHDASTFGMNGRQALEIEVEIQKAIGAEDSDRVVEIKKTLDAEFAERWSCEPLRQAFSTWPGAEPPAAAAPEGLVDTVARFPFDGSVLAAVPHRSGDYFYIIGGDEPTTRIDNDLDNYRFRKLIHRTAGTGASMQLPIERNGNAARVTVMLPVRDTVWFGTHEGLTKYDTRRNEWRWLGAADGVPTNSILCGADAEGTLWFGCGADKDGVLIFSLEPGSGRVRTYRPNSGQGVDSPRGITVRKDVAFVVTRFRVHQIDLRSGRWTTPGILPPAGQWAVNRNETRRTGYQPTTVPVFCRERWWMGTTGGLAMLEPGEPPAFRILFSSGHKEDPTEYEALAPPCIPPDCPIRGSVSGLATDGSRLWMTCNGLASYDPKHDLWHGPFAVPGNNPLVVGKDIWLLDRSCIKVNIAAFLKVAETAGMSWTTANYRAGLAKAEPEVERGLRAAANLRFSEAAACFENVAASDPENVLPLFWKAYCLKRESPPNWAGAIKIYDGIVGMAVTRQTNGIVPPLPVPQEVAEDEGAVVAKQQPTPSPRLLRQLAENARIECLFDSGWFESAFRRGMSYTNSLLFADLASIPAWAAMYAGRLGDAPAMVDAEIGRFLGPDFGLAELQMTPSAWDAVIRKDTMETLWQKGLLTQAVARVESESYTPFDAGLLYLDASLPEKSAQLLRKSILESDYDGYRFRLIFALLYRDAPLFADAGKHLRDFLETSRLSPEASHSMKLLQLRLEALQRAGPSGAAALFRAEGALYRGLYHVGEKTLDEMAQKQDDRQPLLQAEAARLLWESRTFAHGGADAALLQVARTRYQAAAKGRGPEALWACYGLMRLAAACGEDTRTLASEAVSRFARSVVAEEARRFLSASNTNDPPVLCAHMPSPQDVVATHVFPRRGFVIGSLGDQCYKITQAAWVDGMGTFINTDSIDGRSWHARSLVWPGYAFRPGLCVVDYYAGRQFLSRRMFIVKGEVPNETDKDREVPGAGVANQR